MKLYNENIQYWRAIHWPFLIVVFAVFLFVELRKGVEEYESISWDSAVISKCENDQDSYSYIEVRPVNIDTVYSFRFRSEFSDIIGKVMNTPSSIKVCYREYHNQNWAFRLEVGNDIIVNNNYSLVSILIPSIVGLIGIIGVIFVVKGSRRGDFDELMYKDDRKRFKRIKSSKDYTPEYYINEDGDNTILSVFYDDVRGDYCRDYRVSKDLINNQEQLLEIVKSIYNNPENYTDIEVKV